MTRMILATTLAVLATAAPQANALTMQEARQASRLAALDSFEAFTEKRPTIEVTCHRRSKYRARCKVRYEGDRLKATINASVEEIVSGFLVRFGAMR